MEDQRGSVRGKMAGEEQQPKRSATTTRTMMTRRREMETQLLEKVSDAISAINAAKHVDDVIVALHSVAVVLFPVDCQSISGLMSDRHKDQLTKANIPLAGERHEHWQVFYLGTPFPALARILLFDVASNWLPCFTLSAQKHVYDVFFVQGLTYEVVQSVVPCLSYKGGDGHDANAVKSNAERILELCLVQNAGVSKMAREFNFYHKGEDFPSPLDKPTWSRVAQLLASIPDKARLGAPKSLSSHSFFKQSVVQLLTAAVDNIENCDESTFSCKTDADGALHFCGDLFARISRRGSADLLASEIVARILRFVRTNLSGNEESVSKDVFMREKNSRFWSLLMELIKDSYAVERLTEVILHQLASEHVSNVEAYWILWILFNRSFAEQASIRFLFLEKFILWKVLPLCCLKWILQFSVLQCPPDVGKVTKSEKISTMLDAVQRLTLVWAKREFVQSAPIEQQSYITAGIGLILEAMSKEELDSTKDVMRSILEGVSCRLESPSDIIRKMASSIALVFSKVVDPSNPLYLDDNCRSENIDWEFGLVSSKKGTLSTSNNTDGDEGDSKKLRAPVTVKESNVIADDESGSMAKSRNMMQLRYKAVDPDEVIDPATLVDSPFSDEDHDDVASESFETSSDSSLEPYDLADDDSDLKRNFTQLVDVVAALRKSDDPDGVERALAVAEKLIRASPDELHYVASDLVRTLVQVRCSDTAVEGDEDSDEENRQRALVALLVTCPFESLDSINKLLYSPHLDLSQRILILDVMTDAAQELANTRTVNQKFQSGLLISSATETQPWFMPSDKGPPGAGPWKEISDTQTPLNWSHRYERELPSTVSNIKKGKTRRWSLRPPNSQKNEIEWTLNKFPLYAAAFMLPVMRGFDKKSHGVDLLGRDFIVLGKLIHMLGICMKCAALHPEASALAPHLLDMLNSREVCHHREAYVRRAVLFAASCILMALHPCHVASALLEGNQEFSRGLEWIRTWALHVAESDTDRDCYSMAMACLQLHAEMALQASRAVDSAGTASERKSIEILSSLPQRVIKIPGRSSLLL
ncbi:hypothetical protein Droror1_Dr00004416 [Drosera rotundifolia]